MAYPKFIVVDDDPISNTICRLTLEMVLGQIDLESFTNPKEALDYVARTYATPTLRKTILLLDINMPVMSGWEFLERFDALNQPVKSCIDVFILSSSVDPRDKDRSYSNKNVSNFLIKPLTVDAIKKVLKINA